jgi:hypothetical protein
MAIVTEAAYRMKRAVARRKVLGETPEAPRETARMFNAGYDAASPDERIPVARDNSKPNHYAHDSLGDPATCTGDHNHPEPDE